jgi:molybdate transport system regulatory protein
MPRSPTQRHAAKPIRPGTPAGNKRLRARLRLVLGDDIAIGPGKADLLDLIRDTGSIAAAGRAMGMSYKRAWLLVTTMNDCFKTPLVVASRGGSERGGASLTVAGEAVLAAYRRLGAGIEASADLAAIRALTKSPRKSANMSRRQ